MKKHSKLIIAISFIFGSLFLTSCNVGDEISTSISENLVPNVWSLLAQIFATVVLFVCLFFLAYKPTKKFLNKRKELLNNEVEQTKKDREEAQLNKMESDKNIATSKKKAKEIVDAAKVEATSQANEILANADEEAKRRIKDSEDVIKHQKAQALEEIKGAITDVAFDATTKILEREVNEADNQKIIDDFVDELKDKK